MGPDAAPPAERPVRTHRPRTQLYTVLSVLWVFPSLGALLILALAWPAWRRAGSVAEAISSTGVEQWLALLLLLLHPAFLLLARHYRKNEPPKEIPPEEPPSDEPGTPAV